MRPQSLAEVAGLVRSGAPFDACLKNFLDEFYLRPDFTALISEPALLAGIDPVVGPVEDAYLAATAESLSALVGSEAPVWAFADARKLKRPWFALEYPSLRALLLWERPAPFRSRNLFVSENALSRA